MNSGRVVASSAVLMSECFPGAGEQLLSAILSLQLLQECQATRHTGSGKAGAIHAEAALDIRVSIGDCRIDGIEAAGHHLPSHWRPSQVLCGHHPSGHGWKNR